MRYFSSLCNAALCGWMALGLAACGDPPEPPVRDPSFITGAQGARVVIESGPVYSKATTWNDFGYCFWNVCPQESWTWHVRLFPLTPEDAWQRAQEIYKDQLFEIERWKKQGIEPPHALRSLEFSQMQIEKNCKDNIACDEPNLKDARESAARSARHVACAEAVMQQPKESQAEWYARVMNSEAGGVAYMASCVIDKKRSSGTALEKLGLCDLRPILEDACPEKH